MNTAVTAIPLRQVSSVKQLLVNDQARGQLAAVAAKHMSPERMMRVVANAIRTTPKLQDCEPMSFLGALMQCAALGLEPNTVLGHAYLIPFENNRKKVTEVQVVVGYKGLIDLARRSGHITSISANIHYSDDELWEYEEGTEARLRHRPGDLNGKKMHAYAIAQFRDGGHAYVVLPWSHVMKIRDGSQGWQTAVRFGSTAKSPWHTHEDAMAKKTAIRALAKYLPLSVEFSDAVAVDEKKADYRAFAMDPTAGVTIDGEAEEDQPQEEAKPEPKPAAKPKPVEKQESRQANTKPAQQVAARHVEARNDQDQDEETQADENGEVIPQEPDWSENGFGKGFLMDVGEMGLDAAMDLHAEGLDRIKDEKPGLFSYLMAEGTRLGG